MGNVHSPRGITAEEIWEYITRTLTNLDDTRASKIDNLDATISSRMSNTYESNLAYLDKPISSLNDISMTDVDNVIKNRFGEYYMYDDFGDNTLTDRKVGYLATYNGLLKNLRPVWTINSGSPSVSDGILELPDGYSTTQQISTPSTFDTGTWEFKWKGSSGITDEAFEFRFLYHDGNNYRRILITKLVIQLSGYKEGSFGSLGAYAVNLWDDDWHVLKVTRDTDGHYEVFLDGSSIITATETWLPPSPYYIQLRNKANSNCYIDYIKIY